MPWETFYEKYQTVITDAYLDDPKITALGRPLSKYEPKLTEKRRL